MPISFRSAIVVVTLALLMFVLPTFGRHIGTEISSVVTANAAGFEDPAIRRSAAKNIIAHTVPGPKCRSLQNNKNVYFEFCLQNMLPLRRKYCEARYREILNEKVCKNPNAPQGAMDPPERCEALRMGYSEMCGATKDPDDEADCTLTAKLIDTDCN